MHNLWVRLNTHRRLLTSDTSKWKTYLVYASPVREFPPPLRAVRVVMVLVIIDDGDAVFREGGRNLDLQELLRSRKTWRGQQLASWGGGFDRPGVRSIDGWIDRYFFFGNRKPRTSRDGKEPERGREGGEKERLIRERSEV